MPRDLLRTASVVFVLSFLLNVIWEFAQMPLYREGSLPFLAHAPMCFYATLWDAGYTLTVYLVFTLFLRDARWIERLSAPRIVLVAAVGFAVAWFVEWRALRLGKWAYNSLMPLVPFLGAGLTPFLQLALLSILTYALVGRIGRKRSATIEAHV